MVGVLALFGDRISAAVFKPKLHLELKSKVGSYSPQHIRGENEEEATMHARYYHLRVTNRAIYPKAKDVQILLLGVERTDRLGRRPGDLYVPLPLGWSNGLYPPARTIGSKTDGVADLLYVRDDVLRFVPIVQPLNFKAEYSGRTRLRVTAVARGLDCESKPLRLLIDWDGNWDRDDDGMARHFKITVAA